MNNNTCRLLGIILVFVVLFPLSSLAQNNKTITLSEAIQLGLKNNKQLKISAAKIDEATANVQAATDARLPDFNVSGNYLRLGNANVDLKNNNGSGNSGAGIKANQAIYGMANLSLPIYAAGRLKLGIESARLLKEASQLDAEQDAQAATFNIIQAYINLYKAATTVSIVEDNLKTSNSRDSSFSNLEKNGIMARNDLLKSQLQTSNIELALLESQNNFTLAVVNMNLLLGLPTNEKWTFDTSFVKEAVNFDTYSKYEANAFTNRKDLQSVDTRLKASALAIQSAERINYPTVALTGGYIAAYIPKVISITNAVNAGIGVQFNLSQIWKKNTKLMQARAQQKQVDANKEMLQDAISLSIQQDYQNVLLNQKKIEVYQKSLEQATENYRITNNKFNNSLSTITELLEANTALLQANLNINLAKADAILAYQKLLLSSGITQ